MKFLRLTLMALAVLLLLLNPIISRAADSPAPGEARQVIKRTAVVLVAAQQAAKNGRFYNGLALAVAHQRLARELYQKQQYLEAIFHALRARGLAVQILRVNKAELIPETLADLTEEKYLNQSPPNSDLDAKVKAVTSNEAAANAVIELEI